jgi:hypothetical protein
LNTLLLIGTLITCVVIINGLKVHLSSALFQRIWLNL